jgi:hypothetical protein
MGKGKARPLSPDGRNSEKATNQSNNRNVLLCVLFALICTISQVGSCFVACRCSSGEQAWDEADTYVTTAIQHAPTRIDGQAMLGRLRLERGEYAEALTALKR